ncbi:MAG: DUF2828 family protein [Eubacterium sp.]|nr:DUF2828 family protein [Eubacterium sp.]
MNFAEAAKMNAAFTRTENGAVALNTTGDARLDLFGTIGSLRSAEKERITRLFADAWKADPLFATKIVFYARDVRKQSAEYDTIQRLPCRLKIKGVQIHFRGCISEAGGAKNERMRLFLSGTNCIRNFF